MNRTIAALMFAFGTTVVACSAGTAVGPSDASTDSGPRADAAKPPPINAKDYDQSCQANSDCAVVDEGDPCGCPGCGNAAVNKSQEAKFNADFAAAKAMCTGGPMPCPAIGCVFREAACTQGKCSVCNEPGCSDSGSDAGSD